MFNMWSFDNIDAICASGLGGGSLIYANVLLRKDEDWFVKEEPGKGSWKDGYEYWPVTRADLDPHYDRVERMMNVQKYPLDQAPYDKTLKTLAFRDAARKLGLDWNLVNLAVTFANDGDPPMVGEPIKEDRPNYHGRTRLTCKLTGECDLGCNHGSKNTLDYTYITAAMARRRRHPLAPRGARLSAARGRRLRAVLRHPRRRVARASTPTPPSSTSTRSPAIASSCRRARSARRTCC